MNVNQGLPAFMFPDAWRGLTYRGLEKETGTQKDKEDHGDI